jgi:hypothetical protein
MSALRCLLIAPPNMVQGTAPHKDGVLILDAAAHFTFSLPENGHRSGTSDTIFQNELYHFSYSFMINEVQGEDFDLLFVAGDHTAMWYFPDNSCLRNLLGHFIQTDKPVIWLAMTGVHWGN